MDEITKRAEARLLSKLRISTHRRDLDMAWVRHSILTSPWGGWMDEIQFNTAIEFSLCFGVYVNDPITRPLQIAFARVVTDRSAFSSVMDVFVRPEWRGQGVGSHLLKAVIAHDWVRGTICVLDTADADGLYEKFGFARRRPVMQRDPEA